MAYQNLPHAITDRTDAATLLDGIRSGIPESELVPFIHAMTSSEDEQGFAIMRGSGNEMSLPLQLVSLLVGRHLITQDQAFEAIDARNAGKRKDRS